MFKLILFTLHKIGIYIIPYMVVYTKYVFTALVIILSWKLNNNKCLITS